MSFQTKQTEQTKQNKQTSMTKKQERERSPSPEPIYKNKKYEVPSKETYFFDRCEQPITEICEATNYFQQLPDDIKIPMLKYICEQSREGPSVYGEYDAPPDQEIVESINGKGGYFLKKTTEAADIYLIWYNRQKNIYKFWGPTERAVKDAMNRIRGRIVKYVIHLHTSQARRQEPSHHVRRQEPSHQARRQEPSHQARRQEPSQYNISKHDDLASSPPPCQYSKPVCDEEEEEYNPHPLMRSESMAVGDGYDYSLEEEAPQPLGLCRSMSMM